MREDYNWTIRAEKGIFHSWIDNEESLNESGDTVLHSAFKHFEFLQDKIKKILEFFFKRGNDLNVKNDREETILHLAVVKQFRNIIDFLLEHGGKIDVTDEAGNTIAHYFIKKEFFKILNLSNKEKTSSNRAEVEKESIGFVEYLLSKGFDFDLKNHEGKSALHLAIASNLQHILPPLLKNSRDIKFVCDIQQRTLLHSFINANNGDGHPLNYHARLPSESFTKRYAIEIVKILIDRGVFVNHLGRDGLTVLHKAIRAEEQLDLVELLLDSFMKIDNHHRDSLIDELVEKSSNSDYYVKVIRLMLTKDTELKRKFIHSAVEQRSLKVVELLKAYKAEFNIVADKGRNLLHLLADRRWYDDPSDDSHEAAMFNFLVNEGCDVNAVDYEGQTPLHIASMSSNLVVIQKLIDYGVDVNVTTMGSGWTPLHLAISAVNKSAEVVELLLDNGARVNGINLKDERPLHLAIGCNYDNVILKLLLDRGAEVNARDANGETALMKACRYNYVGDVEKLIAYGANVNDVIITCHSYFKDRLSRKIILRHWRKLVVADLIDTNEDLSDPNDLEYRFAYEKYPLEVEKLKKTMIDNFTSIYDWLKMNVHVRYTYSRNEGLRSIVDSMNFEDQFPHYSTVILAYYRQTLSRRLLLKDARLGWLKLTGIYLPDVCLECIFSFLKNTELDLVALET